MRCRASFERLMSLWFAAAMTAGPGCALHGTDGVDGSSSSSGSLSASDASLLYVSKQGDTMTGTLVVSGGNIGIGASNPTNQFHIQKSASSAMVGATIENTGTINGS